MKKVFLLPKGLDKFSKKELKNMEAILGGTVDVPDIIYYPTSGGRRCAEGQVWSETLRRCVVVAIGTPVEHR
ncbi:hypothetical protein SAMN04487910_0519 [Aquimarina amphilecti]|uniref:Uncharacterized protein n=1 Tax=Aquimarina amphilecti TaxID=1038014 RepID=A0A1H7GZI2_AQUAM|nr:hypothetical protein [Aquimarina amphilecti]SEK43454.1 hypothetical protein SAMN04487910_0519 [Aquimarina amphilecti]